MDTSSNVVLLASSWLNVGMCTLELALCQRYFKRPNRPLLYKWSVGAFIVFDTLCTLTICTNVSLIVLAVPLGPNPLASLVPTTVVIILTYCTAAVEQAILCHLFFTLTKNIIVSGLLAVLILGHMGLAVASGSLILTLDSEHTVALATATAAAVTCAATDLFIAIALASKVWKMLSPTDVLPASHSFVRKFLLLVVSSGLIVASNTLIMMSLLLKGSLAFDFFFSCQGRVYSVTLLANFLVGIHFRQDTTPDPSTSQGHHLSGVVFDTVDGYDTYDTQNTPNNGPRTEVDKTASKSVPAPYNYNLDAEWMQFEHQQSFHVKSEP
ncbi:hypothetical protein DFH07DRAFT_999897 [Mycena maculata]|uniref:Transmembrane protein n=1 Tax=Mycena maculata TaxID=230809 RepID=A0AAD7HSX2_9AGAR|nr:hypothetical protein DFH07DRAFT_999897 [Mycena maculata]